MSKHKNKKRRQSKIPGILKKQNNSAPHEDHPTLSRSNTLVPQTAASDPTGSCRYTDTNGQIQCESPVPKSYCDTKTGFFTPSGRC